MKLIGHVFVAIKAFPKRNKKLLAFGALIPETVFYVKEPALTFEQIHEGGLKLYHFCKKYYPDWIDLGIGAMTHGAKYGADSYNSLASLKPLGFNQQDIPKIAKALKVDLKTAQWRVHNLYDLALDYYLNKKYPKIKNIIDETKQINKLTVAKILSQCYSVSEMAIKDNLDHLWDKYDLSLLESFEGLTKFWKSLASDLKEPDPVDIIKTTALFGSFYNKLKPQAKDFIEEVIENTRSGINKAIA